MKIIIDKVIDDLGICMWDSEIRKLNVLSVNLTSGFRGSMELTNCCFLELEDEHDLDIPWVIWATVVCCDNDGYPL